MEYLPKMNFCQLSLHKTHLICALGESSLNLIWKLNLTVCKVIYRLYSLRTVVLRIIFLKDFSLSQNQWNDCIANKWEPLTPLSREYLRFFKYFVFLQGLLGNEVRSHHALETSLEFMEEIAFENFCCSRGIIIYSFLVTKKEFI